MGSKFAVFASKTSRFAGHPLTFVASCLIIVVWGAMGPFLGYSDTWQLAINTGTTIVTFLMVFLIQNTQNRESAAVQIKLDELIRATHSARNTLLDLEELSEDQLNTLLERYREVAKQARDPNISEVKELGKPEVVAAIAEEVDAAADAPADSEERKERVETAAAKAVGVAAEDVLSPVKERAVRKRRKATD
ncbi:low affinity iron permease family protein [Alsobacter soli]|uniref:Low affinity iron permease family protein n=1 Tax=Alsobacter soli TaxID=2109933 RepID=A0A2T1HU77_9HYPH|nr:low affinity iron permease family protein [Alsobacter soli]PSC05178.1 low affinity iron permease family protein [Alsobacter soli]